MFWDFAAAGETKSQRERVLPTGTVELVIRLSKNENKIFNSAESRQPNTFSGSVVTGPQAKYFVLDKGQQDTLIGVHFRPGGAFPFFKVPLAEIQDRHLSLEDLWGPRATELRERLLEAKDADARFRVIEQAFFDAFAPLGFHPAVRFALERLKALDPGALPAISHATNLSSRRLGQLFAEQVGLSPKVYARVLRFQRLLKRIKDKDDVAKDWSEIALASGYYDQPHCIRDFKAFSGLTPAQYDRQPGEHWNHVAIET